ncbi:DER1-domain-containing protein [Cylindrobasidium torrendii FP15055 ss-10]|uniref:Derlin n=1 Tax=Cylindrobasidium torrendii FP15055 ss-10 TaxID=1314674 RepID=A0A0D7BI55_9AGAR|nr:DER1-domain-containing protein [Cylindrobasidium torrendii FP15055 ss-10]
MSGVDGILTELKKIPSVTRFLTLSLVGVTLPSSLGLVSPYVLLYTPDYVFNKLQLWRLYTSFFLGSSGINFVFEIAMLYHTANGLEGQYDSSPDLAWQLGVACAAIVALSTPLNAMLFTRPLVHCLQYLSAKMAPPGAQSNMYGLITFPTAYMPYVMLGIECLMGGPQAMAKAAVGTLVGHVWWWRVWSLGGPGGAQWARAPAWVRGLVGSNVPREGAGYRVVNPGAHQQPQATATGSSWGRGHRLGSG